MEKVAVAAHEILQVKSLTKANNKDSKGKNSIINLLRQ